MTKEENINVSADKDKFVKEVFTEDELDNVAGGMTGREDGSVPQEAPIFSDRFSSKTVVLREVSGK